MLSIRGFGTFLILLLGLPPFGLLLAGSSLPTTLTLFPFPSEPGHSSISWVVFGALGIGILASLVAPLWRLFNVPVIAKPKSHHTANLPWWGWIAIVWVLASWILAWTRVPWFAPWQPHTFPLLWFGYIVVLNGLTYQRTRHCLLLQQPRFFGQLFFLSAGFWWTFEYLNQYVNNWHYVNVPETSLFEYVFFTSLSFSTVLPAVLSTYEWLNTFPRLTKSFENWHSYSKINNQQSGWMFLALGSFGLGLIGIWPAVLFPVLWLSPLCLLAGMQQIREGEAIPCLVSLAQGDWRPVILSAGAALICGFWWELWNSYSLVHWEYTIPYVHALKVFEMPVLGYSGYLPFGITCLAITEVVLNYQSSTSRPEVLSFSQDLPQVPELVELTIDKTSQNNKKDCGTLTLHKC